MVCDNVGEMSTENEYVKLIQRRAQRDLDRNIGCAMIDGPDTGPLNGSTFAS